jgi:hypothetical protein
VSVIYLCFHRYLYYGHVSVISYVEIVIEAPGFSGKELLKAQAQR